MNYCAYCERFGTATCGSCFKDFQYSVPNKFQPVEFRSLNEKSRIHYNEAYKKAIEPRNPRLSEEEAERYLKGDFEATMGLTKLVKEVRTNAPRISRIEIVKVIFNDPATIVLWADGTKTVVKAFDEPFDPEKGLAMAISKKALGNKGNYFEVFKKYIPEEDETVTAELNSVKNDLTELKRLVNRIFGNPGKH